MYLKIASRESFNSIQTWLNGESKRYQILIKIFAV